MILMNLFSGKEWRTRSRGWTCGYSRGRRGWDEMRQYQEYIYDQCIYLTYIHYHV